jgi:uncharacterized membrane protein
MTIDRIFGLKLIAILGCTLISGVFFAFSNFVMNALSRLQPSQGIAAMQSINIAVINPVFMTVFLGTAVNCLFLAISALLKWQQLNTTYAILGSALYLFGTVGITIALNVPLNDTLANVDPGSIDGASLWSIYLSKWTFWNHIRTLAALAATISISLA